MLKKYSYTTDDHRCFNFHQEMLGELWPLDSDDFYKIIVSSKNNSISFFSESSGKINGFISIQVNGEIGSIVLLIFDFRNEIIGKKLFDMAMEYFKRNKVKKVQLGAGGYNYFWPGIPGNLLPLISFFKNNGWNFSEQSYDMLMYLDSYKTPDFVYERINQNSIRLLTADKHMYQKILDFEKNNFPNWYQYYKSIDEYEKYNEVIYAVNKKNEIIGTVINSTERPTWHKLIGNKVGTLGALGVKKSARGSGIGMALAARVTELHKENGLLACFLGYTWLTDWYGKLGYKIWREYEMSWKDVG